MDKICYKLCPLTAENTHILTNDLFHGGPEAKSRKV